jgi:pimeloyl-ACP methyl ester carboxylesterase
VYIAALVPEDGQSTEHVLKPYPSTRGLGHAQPDAEGYLSLAREGIEEDFVPDLPPAEREVVYATQSPWNSRCLTDKVATAAWKTRPSWYVAVNDRMLPPECEQTIASRIKATTITLTSGHVPMLSKPTEIAAVIADAASKAGAASTAETR